MRRDSEHLLRCQNTWLKYKNFDQIPKVVRRKCISGAISPSIHAKETVKSPFAVAPFTGAWIETNDILFDRLRRLSHPSRVRGLKQNYPVCPLTLKQVAPFTGAWIETSMLPYTAGNGCSRTLHGCVDWNMFDWAKSLNWTSRTLHGCVDWNYYPPIRLLYHTRRTLHGCVDWNFGGPVRGKTSRVAPFTGAWIETIWLK